MKLLRTLLCACVLSCAGAAWAAAVPSIHDVYTAATSGHVDQARTEIDQVLAAYPNSAKAHYVSARVAALQSNWSLAAAELAKARNLDPGLGFERRDSLQAFSRQVAGHTGQGGQGAMSPGQMSTPMQAQAQAPRRGFPMGTMGIVLLVLALLILWAVYRASRRPPVQVMPQGWPGAPGQAPYPGAPQGPMGPGPYGPGYGPGAYPPGATGGSGIMGAVGTGLAMGAGVAAGEMLVDKLFDRGGHGGIVPPAAAEPAPPLPDPAALPDDQDFGINDAGSWSDDSSGSDSWN